MKTIEELSALKAEYNALQEKLLTLSAKELQQVTGGGAIAIIDSNNPICPYCLCPLELVIYHEMGRDKYGCIGCRKEYFHIWEGDYWEEV